MPHGTSWLYNSVSVSTVYTTSCLRHAALGSVYPVETSTSLYNLYIDNLGTETTSVYIYLLLFINPKSKSSAAFINTKLAIYINTLPIYKYELPIYKYGPRIYKYELPIYKYRHRLINMNSGFINRAVDFINTGIFFEAMTSSYKYS